MPDVNRPLQPREAISGSNEQEQERCRQALEDLRNLRDEVRARNHDITTEEQALEIADEFSREVIRNLIEKGKIRFEEQQHE